MSATDQSPIRDLATWFRFNRQVALALPEPDTEWTVREVPEIDHTVTNRLNKNGAIERVGRTPQCKDRTSVTIWTTDSGTYEWVQEHIERTNETPCGNSGVRCIEAGETFSCTDADCDCRFGPDTAREVMA